MSWRIEIGLHVRIGREPATPSEPDSSSTSSSESREVDLAALVERSDQPGALIETPIGFRPEPEDAQRSATSRTTPPRAR